MGEKGLDFVAAVSRESGAFADALARPGALGRAVPACPGWTVGDLAGHLGGVQRFWAALVLAGGQPVRAAQVADHQPPAAGRDALLRWYGESRALLCGALSGHDPDSPCWTWWGAGQTVRDAARRQAHEVLIHRWDAQSAVGEPAPLDAELAADGVGEYIERMLPHGPGAVAGLAGVAGVVELVAADTGGSWRIRLDGHGAAKPVGGDPAGATPDVTVRAAASDLDLILWQRVPAETAALTGAPEVFAALADLANLD